MHDIFTLRYPNPRSTAITWAVGLIACFTVTAFGQEQDLAETKKRLAEGDVEARMTAAYELGEQARFAPAAAAQVAPALVAALDDESPLVRQVVLYSLLELGPAAAEAVPTLVEQLESEREDEPAAVAVLLSGVLRAIGPPAAPALPALVEIAQDEQRDTFTRIMAARAIQGISPNQDRYIERVVPHLVDALADESERVQDAATLALGEAGAGAVPALVEALDAAETEVRWRACDALAAIGAEAEQAVEPLTDALGDDEVVVRWHAARALGAIGPAAGSAAEALRSLVTGPSPKVRAHAALALGKIAGEEESLDYLVEQLRSDDPTLRQAALRGIADLGPDAAGAVPELLELLESNPDAGTAVAAADALTEVGPAAAPAIVALLDSPRHRSLALAILTHMGERALGPIGRGRSVAPPKPGLPPGPPPVELLPKLIKLLDEQDVELRRDVLIALASLGERARFAVPVIVERKLLEDEELQTAAAYCLGLVGPNAKPALPALEKLVREGDGLAQAFAALAVVHISEGPTRPEVRQLVTPVLEQAAEQQDPRLSAAARHALERVAGESDGTSER